MKIFDSEMKIMELIWKNEPVSAKELSLLALEEIGWNKNTTYTVIKKLIDKGCVRREEPGFMCSSLITKGEIQKSEARGLLDRFFSGSKKALFSALLEDEDLSETELAELRAMIDRR
ncbi:MAG: BlaI/MecI/CopY family transcriptional regulator [Oscillospiraceae bacterium]|nr:BlaI/MecI/CopY family transcriptional regulator [Oscillospiraceae bacterium]